MTEKLKSFINLSEKRYRLYIQYRYRLNCKIFVIRLHNI